MLNVGNGYSECTIAVTKKYESPILGAYRQKLQNNDTDEREITWMNLVLPSPCAIQPQFTKFYHVAFDVYSKIGERCL